MFERDKDDLRSLGIKIELGTFDPLFEDEAGYRIKPENYEIQLKSLNSTQLSLLAQAAQLFREAAIGEAAQSGLRKLKSIGIESDIDAIETSNFSAPAIPEQLPDLIEAVSERRRVRFEYLNQELISTVRNLEPYRLSNSAGHWYLTGRDLHIDEIRTFRLDRFGSQVSLTSSSNAFEPDLSRVQESEAANKAAVQVAQIKVRKGRGNALRKGGQVTELDSEWDLLEIEYFSHNTILQQTLWLGVDAEIVAPEDLRNELISRLREVISIHG
jgi:proteasome accessory factor B